MHTIGSAIRPQKGSEIVVYTRHENLTAMRGKLTQVEADHIQIELALGVFLIPYTAISAVQLTEAVR
jgi:hypothetical protein